MDLGEEDGVAGLDVVPGIDGELENGGGAGAEAGKGLAAAEPVGERLGAWVVADAGGVVDAAGEGVEDGEELAEGGLVEEGFFVEEGVGESGLLGDEGGGAAGSGGGGEEEGVRGGG